MSTDRENEDLENTQTQFDLRDFSHLLPTVSSTFLPDKKEKKDTAPKKLNEMHHQIIRLASMGMKQVDIAKQLGVSQPMISAVLKSPLAEQKMEMLRNAMDLKTFDVAQAILEAAPIAHMTQMEIMLNPESSEAVRTKIAQDILDRAGFKPETKIRHTGRMTESDLMRVLERAETIEDAVEVKDV